MAMCSQYGLAMAWFMAGCCLCSGYIWYAHDLIDNLIGGLIGSLIPSLSEAQH